MSFDDHLEQVGCLDGVELSQTQVVEDQQFDTDQFPHLVVVAGVQPGGFEPLVEPVGPLEVHADAASTGDVAERGGEEGLAYAGRDGDRLQHLRRVLPCEVRVAAAVHPLFGCLLPASGFSRRDGVLLLVVRLPDGSPGTIPAEATNVFGETVVVSAAASVLSVEGVRHLRRLREVSPSVRRSCSGAGARK